jgi:hypothetical protein
MRIIIAGLPSAADRLCADRMLNSQTPTKSRVAQVSRLRPGILATDVNWKPLNQTVPGFPLVSDALSKR